MLYFSASTNGFYDDAIHSPAQIPADARPITVADHRALMAAQGQGKQIVGDANGDPIAVDPEPVPVVIRSITKRQARLQMLRMRKDGNIVLDMVESVINSADREAQVEWETASTIDRDNALYLQIKQILGFTDEEEDLFFTEGAQIT